MSIVKQYAYGVSLSVLLFIAGCSNSGELVNEIEKGVKETKDVIEQHDSKNLNRLQVTLGRHVDGDTSRFIYKGKEQNYRYLLIDTPETKHPRVGVQPFGPEASKRTESLLKNAKKIEVEYDIGQKQDRYGRQLVYVYVDGKMIQEILVKEGLAQVGYVMPPNTKYLDKLEQLEKEAKSKKIGVWSIGSVFEDK